MSSIRQFVSQTTTLPFAAIWFVLHPICNGSRRSTASVFVTLGGGGQAAQSRMRVYGIVVNITTSGESSMDKAVSAADANRRFSELLRTVKKGRTVIVTSHGQP